MNKKQFTRFIAEHFDCQNNTANAIIDIFSESISLAIAEGHKIDIDNLGTFSVTTIPARTATVRKTGKSFTIKARRQPYFKPADNLKFACN